MWLDMGRLVESSRWRGLSDEELEGGRDFRGMILMFLVDGAATVLNKGKHESTHSD
jgi:hypothetical protein